MINRLFESNISRILVRFGSISGQISSDQVQIWFGFVSLFSQPCSGQVPFYSGEIRVGSVSGCLQHSGLDRVWVESNLGRVGFGSMFGSISGQV